MQLGLLLDVWMKFHNKTVRDMAKEIGISYTVLHKFRNGGNASDATLARIMCWMLEPLKHKR